MTGNVRALAFAKDGPLLAVAAGTPGGAGVVEIVSVPAGEPVASLQGPQDEVFSLAFSADDKLLAAGGADGVVRVWNMTDKKLVATLKEHGNWVLKVSFSSDGKLLASASADRSVRLWEVESWKSIARIQHAEAGHGAAFSPDGNTLVVAVGGANDRSLRVRKKVVDPAAAAKKDKPPAGIEGNPFPRQTRLIDTGAGMPLDIVWHPKGARVYVPCSDKIVKVVEPETGRLAASLTGHTDWVFCAAVSPDGTRIASGSADGTVKLWNAADNTLIATFVQLAPRADEWLMFSTRGYFTASAANVVQWKVANPSTPTEKLTSEYNNPDLVKAALLAKTEATPAKKAPAPEKK